jgi:DNA-binding protein HU-beta
MNKGELIDAISAKTNCTKKDAAVVLEATLEAIIAAVATGDKVTLVGFGSFEGRQRQAREGRNPATGAPIKIPATTTPGFSAGKQFKERVVAA